MKVTTFVRKILERKSDLTNIEVEGKLDKSYVELLNGYIRRVKMSLKYNPIRIDSSNFSDVGLSGIYIPYLQGNDVNFSYSCLYESKLPNGRFEKMIFYRTLLVE